MGFLWFPWVIALLRKLNPKGPKGTELIHNNVDNVESLQLSQPGRNQKASADHTVPVMWILLFATPIGLSTPTSLDKLGAFALADRQTKGNHKA